MKNITAQEAKKLLDSNQAILIDVREKEEFEADHIQGAQLHPLSNFSYTVSNIKSDDKKIVFQCKAGGRSAKACEVAKNIFGEDNIFNLEGGITSWKSCGLKTQSSSTKSCSISIFRQVQIVVGSLVFICIVMGFNISSTFFYAAGAFGAALFFAGLTGWCGLAMLLGKMPWNRS